MADPNPEGYQLIIEILGSDRAYEKLRETLIKIVENRGFTTPQAEELVDEAFDRVSRWIKREKVIEKGLGAVVFGFVKKVILEHLARLNNARNYIDDNADYDKVLAKAAETQTAEEADSEDFETIKLNCLDSCLDKLYPEKKDRQMILGYYGADVDGNPKAGNDGEARKEAKEKKSKRRQFLADEFKLEYGTLRQRVLRARSRLERCVTECLEKKTSSVT